MDARATYQLPSGPQLNDAFAAFIAAANRLENSHWQLHDEVSQLRAQLEERNRALAASRIENERMHVERQRIMDALPCGVAVLESEKNEIVLLNPEGKRLLGVPVDGSLAWEDLPAPVREIAGSFSKAGLQEDEREFCIEKDGGTRWLRVGFCAMDKGASGFSQKLILTFRDITAHRQAEQDRESSRNMVALAEMATVLAHEIRNPLASLELLAGLLASDSGLSEESRQYIQHLRAGVRSLSATVSNVLSFHSLGSLHLAPTKLAATLQSAVEFVRPLAQQNGVSLTLRDALGEAKIAGDAGSLQQIILNLACNALRHTQSEGKITVSGKVEAGETHHIAVVEFSDTGAGISAENLVRIFEPGFSTSRQSPGLGLTICQRIIDQHKGTITVKSELGRGTTFRMEFPVL